MIHDKLKSLQPNFQLFVIFQEVSNDCRLIQELQQREVTIVSRNAAAISLKTDGNILNRAITFLLSSILVLTCATSW
jgi:hypothetical protein